MQGTYSLHLRARCPFESTEVQDLDATICLKPKYSPPPRRVPEKLTVAFFETVNGLANRSPVLRQKLSATLKS